MKYRNKQSDRLTAQLQGQISSICSKSGVAPAEEKIHCICLAASREIAKIATSEMNLNKSDSRHLAAKVVRQTSDLIEEHQTEMFSEP